MTTTTMTAAATRTGPDGTDFEGVRGRLLGIAYRIVGSAADAEDVVQDVWIRWHGADRSALRDPMAFLVTVTTRTALNAATSARARREVSAGGWLPEPDSGGVDPARTAERGEALTLGLQLLMERLLPVERAVYVLHEAFDYPFREIADALGIGEANARQLARRARRHLGENRTRPVNPVERERLLTAFRDATGAGDMACLISRLSPRAPVPDRSRPGFGCRGASGASSGSRRTP